MDKFDIIRLYLDGYSINYITDVYYKFKNRDKKVLHNYLDNKILIINSSRVKKVDCKKYIEKIIFDYLFNNNSVEHFF